MLNAECGMWNVETEPWHSGRILDSEFRIPNSALQKAGSSRIAPACSTSQPAALVPV
jgi:hypothetical protein